MANLSAEADFRLKIRDDPEVKQLVRALVLSLRFHFYILVSEYPIVTNAVLETLGQEVSRGRGKVARIVRLNPYAGRPDAIRAIGFEELMEKVLSPLVAPAPENTSHGVIHLIDASYAPFDDDETWTRLFQRMNERRNLIIKNLEGELILCVPSRLELIFTRAAPDFWSIRSMDTRVGITPPPTTAPSMQDNASNPTIAILELRNENRRRSINRGGSRSTGSPLQKAISTQGLKIEIADLWRQARLLAEDLTSDWVELLQLLHRVLEKRETISSRSIATALYADAIHELAEDLLEMGDIARRFDDWPEALACYEDAKRHLLWLVNRDPQRWEWRHDLYVSLDRIARAYRDKNDLAKAQTVAEEALAQTRTLVKHKPEGLESQSDLASSLERLGSIQHTRGDQTAALEQLQESLRILEKLSNLHPEMTFGWQRDIARVLNKTGDVYRTQGELGQAQALYEKALSLRRNLLQQQPEDGAARRNIAVSCDRLGDVFMTAGDHARAKAAYEEGIRMLSETPKQASAEKVRMFDLAILKAKLANIYRVQEDWNTTIDTCEAVSQTLGELSKNGTGRPSEIGALETMIAELRGLAYSHVSSRFNNLVGEANHPKEHRVGESSNFVKRMRDLKSSHDEEITATTRMTPLPSSVQTAVDVALKTAQLKDPES